MTLRYILAGLAGYLLGSASISVILTRIFLHEDVREHGSGNAGATNVARVFGMLAGLLTLAGDMLKTAVAGFLGKYLAGDLGLVIGCALCLIGHCWPVYFKFRGGKGVSVSACIGLLLDWRLFLILLGTFFLMFLLTRKVSACSIAAALVFPIAYWFLHPVFSPELCLCLLICFLVIFLHRSNIRRLARGEEADFKPKTKEQEHPSEDSAT